MSLESQGDLRKDVWLRSLVVVRLPTAVQVFNFYAHCFGGIGCCIDFLVIIHILGQPQLKSVEF